jgi:hypothetical protein
MRKILSILTIAMLVVLSSCELNDIPVFDDSDAFVSFNKSSLSVNEDGTTLNIPVTLASTKGKSATVTYIVTNGTAVQGTNFTLADPSATLTFDATNRTQNIVVNIIDIPGVFTGDVRFSIELSDEGTVKPSTEKTCTVTIADLDHPLSAILGTWSATGTSYFNASQTWELALTKDADDVSIVWIYPLVPGGSHVDYPIYGVVNAEMTEIKIPVGQEISAPGSYGYIELRGYYGPDGMTEIPAGGSITVTIEEGQLTILDEFGSYVWSNPDLTGGLGWFNIFMADVVLTR